MFNCLASINKQITQKKINDEQKRNFKKTVGKIRKALYSTKILIDDLLQYI